ncbi:hypothetical protein G6514_005516 [Epicoccum nigrum]|nr:hypothetical protein G6514_005516 [Epicoccum nigrum]
MSLNGSASGLSLSLEKLRSTCNQCALSKVRCNKRKPVCQRCETHDFECVYDRSRRRGKPRSSQQQRQLDGWSTAHSAQSGGPGPYNWPYTNGGGGGGIDAFSKLSSLLPGDDTFDCSLWADPNGMFYGDTSDSTRGDGSSSGEMPMEKSSRMAHAHAHDQQQSQTGDSSVGTAVGRQLYETTEVAQVSSGHLLQTNRTMMDRLQTLLKNNCSYCAQHVDLGVLLSTAVSKMLAWYRAVLDSMIDTSAKDAASPAAHIAITPIMLGDFELDPTTETRMKAQLLLCELQNIAPLLNLLSERNNRVAAGGDVYTSLDKQLRASFAELTSEINALVVRGSKE